MSDAPVYILANLTIRDKDAYRKYEKGFFPLLARHGGELLAYDDSPETFEGEAPRQGRVVILRFPSADHARRWYADRDYQAISEDRRRGSDLRFLTLVRGTPRPTKKSGTA
jgi:uncharacterized protein (DUF1330 family)